MSAAHPSAAAPPSLASLQQLIAPDLARTDRLILDMLRQDVPLIEQIGRHIIQAGGKRLRPALVLACATLCGYEGERHIVLAAALEFLHTATLLHDDVVDESTLRRGHETANARWSNQASVLVGDFLLSRAFQLMVGDGSLEILKLLSDSSATISQGEVMQLMAASDLETDAEHYVAIIRAKTAALFTAATSIGPILTDAPDEQRQALAIYGDRLGVGFQIVDDALDYAAEQRTLGKTVGDDFREGKMTLPVILCLEDADAAERAFWERTIGQGEHTENDLSQAILYIQRHHAIRRSLDQAAIFLEEAEKNLKVFPASAARNALSDVLGFCLARSA